MTSSTITTTAAAATTTTTTTAVPIRKLGHVKFFNSTKGYGFIIPTEQLVETVVGQPSIEVFVHHTAILGEGFKSLAEGETVEYDLIQGPKGLQAANVSGPDGKPVRGDPNAHRLYHHNHHYRYQSGNNHHHNQHHSQQQQQHHYNHRHNQYQQQQHNYGNGGEGNPEGINGHLGYTMYGMPYGYHPIYPAGPYMVPTTGYYHQFTSSQSSPQLKPSVAMYYSYLIPPPPISSSSQQQQQQSYGVLSNSSSSLSSNHTATTAGEPESVEASSSSPSS